MIASARPCVPSRHDLCFFAAALDALELAMKGRDGAIARLVVDIDVGFVVALEARNR
jgi:hypothetical protein